MPNRPERQTDHLEDCQMPKLKTKSGAKKRFRLTASGKVRMNQAYMRHGMRKRPQKMKRKARGSTIMSASDARIVRRNFLPNA
jgi:large subunit ribosomal protein L35